MKLSVIIPIYNVEKYIEDCLRSCLLQKAEDVEFILVDDGSKDRSVAIAERLVQEDSRFKILHKSNGGLSDARNYGVSHCSGEYVFFLDSDDTIEEEMIESVLKELDQHHPDLLVFDMLFVWDGSSQRKVVPGRIQTIQDPVRSFLRATPSACNKIIKRTLALDFPFPYGMFYEDLATIPMIVAAAKEIRYVDRTFYHYRQREGSIIYTFNQKTLDVFKCFERIFQYYRKQGLFEMYHDELEAMAIEHLMLYANRRFVHAKEGNDYLKRSKETMERWFPGWKKNSCQKQFSFNDRMFIQIAATGNIALLKGLLALKQRMKGKGA